MSVDARKERFELVEVFDRPMLFTSLRVDRNTVPKGLYLYEVRNDDDQCGIPVEIGRWIMVNHWGTLLSATPIKLEPNRYNNNHFHIVIHKKMNVLQIGAGKPVVGDFCNAAVLHIAAKQPRQHGTDLRFSFAALALEDHHALPLGAGNEAIADILLKGGNVLRVEQIGKKPKPDNRLSCLWIVVDGKPAAHDLRPSRKETAVNAERPVLHMNFIRIRRKALCMNHQLHDLHDIGNGAQNVFCGTALQLGIDFLFQQQQRVCQPPIRCEECVVRIDELVFR